MLFKIKSQHFLYHKKGKSGFYQGTLWCDQGCTGERNSSLHGVKWNDPVCIHIVDVAVYSSPEHIHGYDYVTSCYREEPQESFLRILEHMKKEYPAASEQQIRKVLK